MALLTRSKRVHDAPIPGENYTSDTKNYPWHRPPKFTHLNDAIEWSFSKMMEEPSGLLTMIKADIPIADLTELFLLNGMSKGNWTPDFMLLMAGPIAHIMYLMAQEAGLKPNMDLGEKSPKVTPGWIDMMSEFKKERVAPKKLDVDINKVKEAVASQGFMDIGDESESEDSLMDSDEDLEDDAESAFEDDEVGFTE